MSDLSKLTKRALKFRDERDWEQFHTPKDIAMDISIEASEILEHFLWKTSEEAEEYIKSNKSAIADELCDTLHGILLMANKLNINLADAFEEKMKQNEKKYPVEKVKGKTLKYTEL